MAAVDENFVVALASVLPNGTVIEESTISEDKAQTRVWFRRADEETELHLDGTEGLTTTEFDVEVHSTDIDEAQELAAAIKAPVARDGLHGFQGTMGDMEVAGVFVSNQDDSYQPKGLNADDGFFVPALKVKVMFDGGQS